MQILEYKFKIKTFKDILKVLIFLQISICVMYYFSEARVKDNNMRFMDYIIPQNTIQL